MAHPKFRGKPEELQVLGRNRSVRHRGAQLGNERVRACEAARRVDSWVHSQSQRPGAERRCRRSLSVFEKRVDKARSSSGPTVALASPLHCPTESKPLPAARSLESKQWPRSSDGSFRGLTRTHLPWINRQSMDRHATSDRCRLCTDLRLATPKTSNPRNVLKAQNGPVWQNLPQSINIG